MPRPAKILLVGTSVATVAFAAGLANAQDGSGRRIDNLEVSLGDVFAGQRLKVIDPAQGVALTTTAQGAAVEVEAEDEGAQLDSLQLTRSVRARTGLEVHGWSPSIDAVSAAVGTGVNAEVKGGDYAASTDQVVGVDSTVAARTKVKAELSTSGDTTATAVAIGNDQATQMDGGRADIRSGQYHYGDRTRARVDAGLVEVQGSASMTAFATANQHGLYGSADRARLDLDQAATGATQATVVAEVGAGRSVSVLSAAAANTASVGVAGGRVDLKAVQSHEGYVRGEAYLTTYGADEATVMTAALGNSVSADVYGPELTLDTDQMNSGGVEAEAAVFGGTGGAVTLSATAIGNAVHGSVCTECDGSLEARNNQVNSGDVSATSRADLGGSPRSVSGLTNAVGNSASYIVNRTR